jgi:heme-degrading monooxygenase HmoA
METYTLGIWRVKAGHEDEFVEAWQALASATASEFPGASAVLLRDRDEPSTFISSGPWESLEMIETWRASDTFRVGVGRIRDHLEGFEPHTMDVAASAR